MILLWYILVTATSDKFKPQKMLNEFILFYDFYGFFFQCLSDGPTEPVPPGKSNVNMYTSLIKRSAYDAFLE